MSSPTLVFLPYRLWQTVRGRDLVVPEEASCQEIAGVVDRFRDWACETMVYVDRRSNLAFQRLKTLWAAEGVYERTHYHVWTDADDVAYAEGKWL